MRTDFNQILQVVVDDFYCQCNKRKSAMRLCCTQICWVVNVRRILCLFYHSSGGKQKKKKILTCTISPMPHSLIMRFQPVTVFCCAMFLFRLLYTVCELHATCSTDLRRHEWNETTMLINFLHVKRLFRDYRQRAHIIFYSELVMAVPSLILYMWTTTKPTTATTEKKHISLKPNNNGQKSQLVKWAVFELKKWTQ